MAFLGIAPGSVTIAAPSSRRQRFIDCHGRCSHAPCTCEAIARAPPPNMTLKWSTPQAETSPTQGTTTKACGAGKAVRSHNFEPEIGRSAVGMAHRGHGDADRDETVHEDRAHEPARVQVEPHLRPVVGPTVS